MSKQAQTQIGMEGLPFQVHFGPSDFDDLINAHGVPFVHFRGMRCPVGLKGSHDARRTDDCHMGCSNGFVYTKAGQILCAPSGNSAKLAQHDPGILTGASISVTPPRYYADPDGSPKRLVQLLQFDRMYLADEQIAVPTWETFEAHETGIDRLRFPVVEVVDLMDNLGHIYTLGDFSVREGKIVWGSRRPGVDPDTGKGRVCSVRYTYRPFWYVSQLVHEVRVATVDDPETGQLKTVRMPQSAILQREYVFESTERDKQAVNPNDPRQVPEPYNGGFSAR